VPFDGDTFMGILSKHMFEQPLPPSQVYPYAESAAANGPIQGSLILFKLKTDSLQNRPLVLEITQAGEEPSEVDLDL